MPLFLATLCSASLAGTLVETDHWTSRDGLPQNSVTDMLQSADGYLWVTTFGGLARFDGVTFTTYDQSSHPGLPTQRLLSVAERAAGGLWVGTQGEGLLRFDGAFSPALEEDIGSVWDVLEDSPGSVWIAASSALYHLQGEQLSREGPALGRLLRRQDGSVWGSDEERVRCLAGPCPQVPPAPFVRTLLLEDQGQLYAGTLQELYRLQGATWVPDPGPVQPFAALIRSINAPESARAWLTDREGGLWLGLDGAGLARVRRSEVTRISDLSMNVSEAPDGTLYSWACRGVTSTDTPSPDLPWLRHFCGEGYFTPEGHVWQLGITDQRRSLTHRGPSGEVISSLPLSKTEEAALVAGPWLSLRGEISLLDNQGIHAVRSAEDLGESALRVVRAHPEGGVWAQGSSGKLHWIQPHIAPFTLPAPHTHAAVRDVWPTGQGAWVATYGGGMLWLDPLGAQVHLTMAQGLCDNAVSRLLPTSDGFLWMNTNHGAGRVAQGELEAFRRGEVQSVTCELVDSGEGNGPGGLLSQLGLVVLPTIHGAISLDPLHAFTPPVPPQVVIEEAHYGVHPFAQGATVRGPSELTVQTTAISFDAPRGLRFRHRLVGHNDAWSPLSTDRQVRFVNLPAGRYRFEVQAYSTQGQWSEVASLSFVRAPLWWETPWARFTPPVLGVGGLLLLLGLRVRWTHQQNQELREEVSHRHRVERQLREQQVDKERALRDLEQARRHEALGRLAGGVAHDFNNLLSVIMGQADVLTTHPDPEVQEDAQLIISAATKASALTGQLLAFGQREPHTQAVLEVAPILEELCSFLTHTVGPSITLTHQLQAGLHLQLSRSHLEQIVSNLCLNARDAIDHAGRIQVALTSERWEGTEWIVIEVIDDGQGMPPEVVEHVFEPYYTTKTTGRGTGLGLATVHGIVEGAAGHIRVRSSPAGTSFRVRLRRAPAPLTPTPDPAPRVSTTRPLEGLTILLVDDEQEVLHTVRLLLTLKGATVHAALRAQEALEIAQATPIDLLITDVLMPEVSGAQLADRVRERQRVPVLFVSGYTKDVLDFAKGTHLLQKPFTGARLTRAVLDVLAPAGPE